MELVACRKHSGGLRSSFGGIGQSSVKFWWSFGLRSSSVKCGSVVSWVGGFKAEVAV